MELDVASVPTISCSAEDKTFGVGEQEGRWNNMQISIDLIFCPNYIAL